MQSIANVPAEMLRKRNKFTVVATRIKPGEHTKPENDDEYMFFHIRIFLQQGPNESDTLNYADIDKVTYELDPTFRPRMRVSSDGNKQFEVRIWSYGFFKVNVTIFTRWGQIFEMRSKPISWTVTDEERKWNGDEVK